MFDELELLSPEVESWTAGGPSAEYKIAVPVGSMGLDRFLLGSAMLTPRHLRLISRIARRVAAKPKYDRCVSLDCDVQLVIVSVKDIGCGTNSHQSRGKMIEPLRFSGS